MLRAPWGIKGLVHGPPAIDQNGLTGDEIAFIGCEEDDRSQKIIGLLQSPQRGFRDIVFGDIGEMAACFCICKSWGNSIDVNVMRP
jgi:hypothetical protein